MSDLSYAFALDKGKYSKLAHNLLQSIEKNTSASSDDIIVYVVEDNIHKIPDHIFEEFKSETTIIKGTYPNSDYPLSATHAALHEAAKRKSNNEYILGLDTDTVVLDEITIHESSNADLFLVPEVVSRNFWSDIDKSYNEWEKLYDVFGYEFPENERVKCPLDNEIMLPYYNSGVILTKANEFPEKWMNLSKQIYGKLPEGNYFSEMVALSLLTSEYTVQTLPECYNYFSILHATIPNHTKILHYKEVQSLYRTLLFNSHIRDQLADTTIMDEFIEQKGGRMYIDSVGDIYDVYVRKTPSGKFPDTFSGRYTNIISILKLIVEKTDTKWIAKPIYDWIIS